MLYIHTIFSFLQPIDYQTLSAPNESNRIEPERLKLYCLIRGSTKMSLLDRSTGHHPLQVSIDERPLDEEEGAPSIVLYREYSLF